MPTTRYFDQCPPFPSDLHIVPLPKVSLEGLQNGSEHESQLLFQACQEWGFFSLDLRQSDKGNELLGDAERMFDLTRETFDLDQSVLDNYAYTPPHDLTGMWSLISITDIILTCLDHQLGLTPGTLSALSPLEQISETSVRLLLGQSQSSPKYDNITLGGHTDIGSITLLFNVVGGLQILPADRENKLENWLYVKPEPGHALVNIGDTLVEWTGGLLRSSLHRVLTAPGEQALVGRQSVAYLMRPRNSASMQRLKGGIIPPVEEGQDDETRSVNEWAGWRARQIMLGQLKPQTRGGKSVVTPA
ncbi:unnamed protein product [Aspergillus oryzae RIB40]|uniref:DNA, SC010 n=1 Tax=Aspergillus oryzae (strain ATCC 42149 / RIB 40) TaxID=510516 RepID=Q2TXN6_ASPOR|nr:unnamed protein product [Aspergillus oryzae RIB40]BAE65987.1 unnamed protein product [Aspergillus oryzae RIB40]